MNKKIQELINEHVGVIKDLMQNISDIQKVCDLIRDAIRERYTVYFIGNGGSAADCQHIAAEFVGKFQKTRKGLPAIALTTNSSIITAISNDFGYDAIFERQIESLVKPKDIVIGISTSGESMSVLNGINTAKKLGAITIALTGQNENQLSSLVDFSIQVPSSNTQRIQEAHILIGHIICEIVEETYSNQ